MEYKGKLICAIEVYNENDNNRVVARICDKSLETTNGYKVRVIPHVEEVKTEHIDT